MTTAKRRSTNCTWLLDDTCTWRADGSKERGNLAIGFQMEKNQQVCYDQKNAIGSLPIDLWRATIQDLK
jgi:hypothetical protein